MRRFIFSLTFLMAVSFAGQSFAHGEALTVFEATTGGRGIWDHESDFYLVFGVDGLPDLWANLQAVDEKNFEGVVVADQFGKNERRFNASAVLLQQTAKQKVFQLEFTVPGEHGVRRVYLEKNAD